MNTAVFPGSFDPITLGHINIIERALSIFDRIIVAISQNINKRTMFDAQDRFNMALQALEHLPNVDVIISSGLTIDIAKEYAAKTIIRGIRTGSDLEYETQIALTNRQICSDIDTIFMLPDLQYTYISSSAVRELLVYRQDVSSYVPPLLCDNINAQMNLSK